MSIEIKFSFPDLMKKFKEHQQGGLAVLAAAMQTNRSMMFNENGADNGKKEWAPLRWRAGRPLQKTGVLRKSMAPRRGKGKTPGIATGSILRFQGNDVTIGTNLMTAQLMNDGTSKMPGGVMRPKKGLALKIPLPSGKDASDFVKSERSKQGAKAMGSKLTELAEKLHNAKNSKARGRIVDQMDRVRTQHKKHKESNAGGEKFIFRKWVRIPARNMNEITEADKLEWGETLSNWWTDIMNE